MTDEEDSSSRKQDELKEDFSGFGTACTTYAHDCCLMNNARKI